MVGILRIKENAWNSKNADLVGTEVRHPKGGWLGIAKDSCNYYVTWREDRRAPVVKIVLEMDEDAPPYYSIRTEERAKELRDIEMTKYEPSLMGRFQRPDTQYRKVYAFEYEVISQMLSPLYTTSYLTLEELQAYIRKLNAKYSDKACPTVYLKNGSYSVAHNNSVGLIESMRDIQTLIHEYCHILTSRTYDRTPSGNLKSEDKVAGHGPEFVGMLLHITAAECGLDLNILLDSAAKAGVKVMLPKFTSEIQKAA